jgi:hypothetical protein
MSLAGCLALPLPPDLMMASRPKFVSTACGRRTWDLSQIFVRAPYGASIQGGSAIR